MRRPLFSLLTVSIQLTMFTGIASAYVGGHVLVYGGGGNAAGTWIDEDFKESSDPTDLSKSAFEESEFGNWRSEGLITVDDDPLLGHKPSLHAVVSAKATGSLPVRQDAILGPMDNPLIISGAIISWTDNITIEGENGVRPSFDDGQFFYFRAHLDGNMTFTAYASLILTIGDQSADTFILTQPGSANQSYRQDVEVRMPAFLFQPFGTNSYSLEMNISAQAYNDEDFGNVNGTADFFNTAMLDAVYFGDADGNPIAMPQGLRMVGESGMVYDVQAIPELGSISLIGATLIVGSLVGKRRKRS